MKKLFSLLLLVFIGNCFGQSLTFDYDRAGNQVKRFLIPVGNKQNNKPIQDITESDLIKADIYDDIKYYPNPVRDELYLQWDFANNVTVQSISLYSLSGQLIKTVSKLGQENKYTFPFEAVPQAIYNLVLNCSNGEQRTLKIIKH